MSNPSPDERKVSSAERGLVERLEDMSPNGKLRLLVQRDGDVIVSVVQNDGQIVDIEFCAPGAGGGGSPRTWRALRQLVIAMCDDNADLACSHRSVSRE